MAEIIISIPEELKELTLVRRINWQLLLARKLSEEFMELARIKNIVSSSKLTEEQADSLSDEVNLSLAKRYQRLLNSKR